MAQNLTREELEELARNVNQSAVEKMHQDPIPEVASLFEKNLQTMKKGGDDQLVRYLARLDEDLIRRLYAKKEFPLDYLLLILTSLDKQAGKRDADIASKTSTSNPLGILHVLSAANKFDFCLQCLSKKEKASVKALIQKLDLDQAHRSQLESIYNL